MPEFSLAALRGLLPQMSGANFGTTSPQEDADMPLTGLDKLVRYALPMSGYDAPPEPRNDTVAYRTPYGNITEGDIGRATDVAMGASGGGLTTKGIKAYHGSPHDFDRFDLSKIGTGEGAQAYGHGLYFADSEGVAKSYRDALAPKALIKPDADMLDPQRIAAELFDSYRGQNLKEALGDARSYDNGAAIAAELRKIYANPPKGHMYEVNINADPAHFLDWDKGISQQHPEVQRQLSDVLRLQQVPLKNNVGAETTTGQMVDYLERRFGNKAHATDEFKEVGIPGIKYLDQGSRANVNVNDVRGSLSMWETALRKAPADEYAQSQVAALRQKLADAEKGGTSNYVVFNDKLIDIMRKYGLAGLAPLAGYGAIAGQDQQQ